MEVWALRLPGGDLVPPMDDDGTRSFMAWPSQAEAEVGLEHQVEMGYFDPGNEPKVERVA